MSEIWQPNRANRIMLATLLIAAAWLLPAPAALAQAPETDANAYWAEIRDSADPADFEDFLKRFPDHAFASFARAKLSELRPETAAEPPPGPPASKQAATPPPPGTPQSIYDAPSGGPTPQPGSVPTGGDLATSLQLALQEVGCYSGGIDGDWGRGSQGALQRFNALSGGKLLIGAPSQQALDAVSGWQGGKCKAVAKKAVPKKKRASRKRTTKKKTAASRKKQPSRGGVGVSIGIGGVGIGF